MFGKRLTLALALVGMGVLPLTSQAAVIVDDFATGTPFFLSQSGNTTGTGSRSGGGILGGVMDAQIDSNSGTTTVIVNGGTFSLSSNLGSNSITTLRYDATAGFGNFTPPGLNYTATYGANDGLSFNYLSSQAFSLTVNIYDINNTLVATQAYSILGGVGALAQIAFSSFTTFGGFNFTQPIGAFEFVIPNTTGSGGLLFDMVSPIQTSLVPEPTTMALGAMGVVVLAGARTIRRRRNAVQA